MVIVLEFISQLPPHICYTKDFFRIICVIISDLIVTGHRFTCQTLFVPFLVLL